MTASLEHMQNFFQPEVIILNNAESDDAFFNKAVRAKATELSKSLIELPSGGSDSLLWLTRLDTGSLKGM